MTAIAMTEPAAGSDLAGISVSAVRDGDSYVLNGAKTFITGGVQADLAIVVARTSRDEADRRAGLTLLVVEEGMACFSRGRNLGKLGLKSQDTGGLFFDDVWVPVAGRMTRCSDEGPGRLISTGTGTGTGPVRRCTGF